MMKAILQSCQDPKNEDLKAKSEDIIKEKDHEGKKP